MSDTPDRADVLYESKILKSAELQTYDMRDSWSGASMEKRGDEFGDWVYAEDCAEAIEAARREGYAQGRMDADRDAVALLEHQAVNESYRNMGSYDLLRDMAEWIRSGEHVGAGKADG